MNLTRVLLGSVALSGFLCVPASAQLWSTVAATAQQANLQGFTLSGTTLTNGVTTLQLDVVAGRVVGVLIDAPLTATDDLSRTITAAWGSNLTAAASLKKTLDDPAFQRDALTGLNEVTSDEGVDVIAVELSGTDSSARWRVYVAINILPESTFPATRNVIGNPAAPNIFHILSDFQCPACLSLWQDDVPGWRKAPDVYRIAYHHFPLSYHKNAFAAAEASECAAAQGKFWPYADALFKNFSQWTSLNAQHAAGKFATYAKALSLDTNAFKTCQGKRPFKAEVERQIAGGEPAFLTGTPTVYLNGMKITEYSEAEYSLIRALSAAQPSAAQVIQARLNTFK